MIKALTALPVYNEANHVSPVLDEVLRYCREVLVVDDGSRDGTAEILAARGDVYVATHAVNRGYGAALQSAFDFALHKGYDVLVTIDCDGQHEPCLIPEFIARIAEADIVSGSRYLKEFPDDSQPPEERRRINEIITRRVNRQLGLGLTDAFCGFKAYRVPILGKFSLTEMGYAMPLELWVQAVALGLAIVEMPVPLVYLDEARSFGGALDHGETRLKVYDEVLDRAMAAAGIVPKTTRASARWLGRSAVVDPSRRDCATKIVLMTIAPDRLHRQRFATPREDRAMLAVPPMEEAGALAAENVQLRGTADYALQGRSLADLSRQARAELLAAAQAWTTAYRKIDLPSLDSEGLIFLAGHQPELFHPGVWFKNFALGALARRHGAVAVNLVIDSDTMKNTSLPTPCGSPADPRREAVLFDRPDGRLPFEERRILDADVFARFGGRVARRIAPLVHDPLLGRFWPMVLERARHVDRLGYCLAQARHQLEGQWGLQTLEIPQSLVCGSEPFHWFLVHLIANLDRFRDCYNQAVQEYRRANHIRNAAHPVPDLVAEGQWVEAPLWIWTAEQPQRRRLFVSRQGRDVLVSDRAGLELRLSLGADGNGSEAVGQLIECSRQGVKIRSRALITTLWARLALSDLFMHGIGGAKYDQVTDRLIETFFGIPPPGIMVLSATLYLPVPRPQVSHENLRNIRRELRELSYHPEKYLTANHLLDGAAAVAGALIHEKQRWIGTPVTQENAYSRWNALRCINDQLQPWVAQRRQQVLELQSQTQRMLRHEKVLGSREYSFCLYPESYLKDFLNALLGKTNNGRQ